MGYPPRPGAEPEEPAPVALDPTLPTTILEIEAAQDVAAQEMAEEASRIEHDPDGKTVHMGSALHAP